MGDGAMAGWNAGAGLVRASQVAREAEVRRSPNGVRFATYGETGVPGPDLDRMLEAVPAAIAGALKTNTYYFVPLALREPEGREPESNGAATRRANGSSRQESDQAMVAPAWTEDLGEAAICHRNVELDRELGSGHRGVFISTRLMGDRFALSFEFFINVAHAFAEQAGVPPAFAELAWRQAQNQVRGETSLDAWESRHLALGQPIAAEAPVSENTSSRRGRGPMTVLTNRSFGSGAVSGTALESLSAAAAVAVADEKERESFLESAFADALAIYLLSLALDVDYSELRERDYPLLAPGALAERLRLVAALYPANAGYEFAVRYRRRA